MSLEPLLTKDEAKYKTMLKIIMNLLTLCLKNENRNYVMFDKSKE